MPRFKPNTPTLLATLLLTGGSAFAHPPVDGADEGLGQNAEHAQAQQNPQPPHHVQHDPNADTDQAARYIQQLEQMLRDHGIEPPARPEVLAELAPPDYGPIIPEDVDTTGLTTEVREINVQSDVADEALARVRRRLAQADNPERQQAAAQVLQAVGEWVNFQMDVIRTTAPNDPIAAYMIADDTLAIVHADPMSEPLHTYVQTLQQDPEAWLELQSMAAYRRVMARADEMGLLGDWSDIDFQNLDVYQAIDEVSGRLSLISRTWPQTPGAIAAQEILREWAAREARMIAELPAYRYTWNISLEQIGTEERTVYYNTPYSYGSRTIYDQDLDIVYDPHKVIVTGTFRNTSDRHYRYTFVAAVSTQHNLGTSWTNEPERIAAFTQVQTPMLAPGEVYNWEIELSVRNALQICNVGIGAVDAQEGR